MSDDKVVETGKAPAALGPYSQARWAGELLFVSGQLGVNPASGEMDPGGVSGQARQALANLGAILQAAGLDPANLVKSTVFLVDMADFEAVNEVYQEYFHDCQVLPARACVAVTALPKGALVEIESIAHKG